MANVDRAWDEKYQAGATPWDSGIPSRELWRVLEERGLAPGRALELGCGSGTNAVFLARRGFAVTAVDAAPTALVAARKKAEAAGVSVEWIEADVQDFGAGLPPVDFVFDRGCYHCCRRVDLAGYLATIENVTRPGTWMLCLAGNADEQSAYGPPRQTSAELLAEFEPLFHIQQLRPIRFQEADGSDGPLGWSLLMQRRGPAGG